MKPLLRTLLAFVIMTIMRVASAAFWSSSILCANVPSTFIGNSKNKYHSLNTRIKISESAADNLEDNESFDMDALQKRITQQTNQYYDLLSSEKDTTRPPPEDVHIVLFGQGTEDEGVHTIEFPKGSGNNIILAFESATECSRFSEMLKDSKFFNPMPQKSNFASLELYCNEIGVPLKVVFEGTDLRPPSDNVSELTKNPDVGKEKEMLEQIFDVEDSQPDNDVSSWD